jgi:sister-chromatid-cohesion protein PDS5
MGPELRTKLAALKLCRNRCLAHAGTDNAALVAAPVLKLLVTLLANLGAMRPDSDDECVYTHALMWFGWVLMSYV